MLVAQLEEHRAASSPHLARGSRAEGGGSTGHGGSGFDSRRASRSRDGHRDCSSAVERYDPSTHLRPDEVPGRWQRVIDSGSRGRGFESRQSQSTGTCRVRADGPLVVGYRTNASFGECFRIKARAPGTDADPSSVHASAAGKQEDDFTRSRPMVAIDGHCRERAGGPLAVGYRVETPSGAIRVRIRRPTRTPRPSA
jgi:hypothetical protein